MHQHNRYQFALEAVDAVLAARKWHEKERYVHGFFRVWLWPVGNSGEKVFSGEIREIPTGIPQSKIWQKKLATVLNDGEDL